MIKTLLKFWKLAPLHRLAEPGNFLYNQSPRNLDGRAQIVRRPLLSAVSLLNHGTKVQVQIYEA